jgi:hypothetical protein
VGTVIVVAAEPAFVGRDSVVEDAGSICSTAPWKDVAAQKGGNCEDLLFPSNVYPARLQCTDEVIRELAQYYCLAGYAFALI